jgi:aspartate kinase
VVKNAQKLDIIDFPSMEEMARKGAKVLHLPCVQYAWKHSVPLRVLSTFDVNQGSLVKGETGTQSVCGIALQRDLALIKVSKETVSSLTKQCQMLGIEIWNVIEEADWAGILIKQDACAKLDLVFSDKIRNSEAVSLLTVVGLEASSLMQHACDALIEQGISINHCSVTPLSSMLVVSPESVDLAANVLHDAYITSDEALNIQQKQAFLG